MYMGAASIPFNISMVQSEIRKPENVGMDGQQLISPFHFENVAIGRIILLQSNWKITERARG